MFDSALGLASQRSEYMGPDEYDTPWSKHASIKKLGVIAPLVEQKRKLERYKVTAKESYLLSMLGKKNY